MKKIFSILVVLILAFSFIACQKQAEPAKPADPIAASDAPNQTEAPAVAEDDKNGGTIAIAISVDVTTLFPFDMVGAPEYLFSLACYDTLFKFDETGAPKPYLIESYEENIDDLTITMKVREGISFHDGSILDAEAVAWNLNKYKEIGIYGNSYLSMMENAEAVDEYTVVLNMSSWDSTLLYSLARNAGYMYSKTAYESNSDPSYLVDHPVGTGPFMFESRESGVSISLVRFDEYWQGKPHLDGIDFVVYAESLVAQAALESGEIQAMVPGTFAQADQLESAGFQIISQSIPSFCYTVAFNSVNEGDPFCDLRVRQAAAHAIDSESIVTALFGTHGVATNQYAAPGTAFYNDEVVAYEYDLDKAKALMAEAGYANGFSTKIVGLAGNGIPGFEDFTLIIAEQLGQIGITVEPQLLDAAGWVAALGDWGNGMFAHTMGMSNGAGSQIASNYRQGITSGIGAKCILKNDALNEIIVNGCNSPSEESYDWFRQAQKSIFEEQCLVKATGVTFTTTALSPKLHDSGLMQNSAYDATLWLAWIED